MEIDTFMRKLSQSDEDSVGKLINEFANKYRQGAPTAELLPLLTHSDSRFVAVGAWIAAEVAGGERGRDIFPRLSQLLEHDDWAVRFEAVASVPWLARADEPDVILSILRRLVDDDNRVRRRALSQVCLMPDSLFSGRSLQDELPDMVLLLQGVTTDQIRAALQRDQLMTQRLAIAGALRNYGDDSSFMAEIEQQFDMEVREQLMALPRGRRHG